MDNNDSKIVHLVDHKISLFLILNAIFDNGIKYQSIHYDLFSIALIFSTDN